MPGRTYSISGRLHHSEPNCRKDLELLNKGTEPPTAIYIGTRYFATNDGIIAGPEIGFTKMAWHGGPNGDIPYPPEMWFAKEMLATLTECQCECMGYAHRGCRYFYPGWSYNTPEQFSIDFDVVRFDHQDGRFWLWFLTGEQDEVNNREFGKWKD